MNKFETTIERADIYYSGAEVVRKGSVELAEGTQTIYITGLTDSLDQNTVRLFSSEGIKCFNQRFEIPDADNAENETRKIQKEIDRLARQADIRKKQIALWEKNGDFTARSSLHADEITDYIERLPERIEALDREIDELEQKITGLKKELDEAEHKEQQPVFVAEISAGSAGTYPVELRYFEHCAYWAPVYEIYSDAEDSLDVRMRARISQNTDEDWKDISVRLYSGNPAFGGTLPKLDPIYLSFQNDTVLRDYSVRSFRSMPVLQSSKTLKDTGSFLSDYIEEAMVDDSDSMATMVADTRMETAGASVNAEKTMTEYVLPGTQTIDGGSDGIMADLTKYEVPAEHRIIAASGADPHAYLIAKVKPADLPFTESFSASVYLHDKYAGQVFLSPELTEDTIEITLGEEGKVHVSRKEVSRKQSSVLLKGQKTLECTLETKVTNLSGEETTVELRDQIPVSRVNEITVEPKSLSGAALDSKTGFLTKEITVLPNETETFTFTYKITWPKDRVFYESKMQATGYCPYCGSRTSGRFCLNCGHAVM